MGPLLFCLVLVSVTSGLPLDGIDVDVWYVDDGCIAGCYDEFFAILNTHFISKRKVCHLVFILMKARLRFVFCIDI